MGGGEAKKAKKEIFKQTLAAGDFVVRPAERSRDFATGHEANMTFHLLQDAFINVCERVLSAERVDALSNMRRGSLQSDSHSNFSSSYTVIREMANYVKQLPTSSEMVSAPAAVGDTAQLSGRSTVWVSDKVMRLRDVLFDCWRDAQVTLHGMDHWRTIIFVERKSTAHAIAAALAELPELGFLIVGVQTGYSMCDKRITRASQQTLEDFRRGSVNTVVSTAVLEEGVDVPACNLVVMFDLGKNIRAYIQQRGRARHLGSKLFVFVPEAEKDMYGDQLELYGIYEAGMTASAKQSHTSRFGQDISLRLSTTSEITVGMEKVYCIQSTGATLTPKSAIVTLRRYCNKIPTDAYTSASEAQFVVTETKDGVYISDVFIPGHPWFAKATSGPCASKRESKKLAAYAAVIELHRKGELSDRLLGRKREEEQDIFGDILTTGEIAECSTCTSEDQFIGSAIKTKRPAVFVTGASLSYKDLLRIDSSSKSFDTNLLYEHFDLYVFENHEGSSDFFRIGLLASKRLTLPTEGELPPIALHHVIHAPSATHESEELDSDCHETSSANFTTRSTGYTVKKAQGDWACVGGLPIDLDGGARASHIVEFDRWVRRHAYGVVSPPTDEDLVDPPFIMAPMLRGVQTCRAHDVSTSDTTSETWSIDWRILSDDANARNRSSDTDLSHGCAEERVDVCGTLSSTSTDWRGEARVVTTRHGGHVRWYKTAGNSALTPRATVTFKTLDGTIREQSFVDYYSEKYGLVVSPDFQMMSATYESHGHPKSMLKNLSQRNHESEDLKHKKAEQPIFLPADICDSMYPAVIWQDVMKLPSMVHRMESQLLALELTRNLMRRGWIEEPSSAHGVPALVSLLLEAITADSCQEDASYERLETLGDSFIKYAYSASLFMQHPGWHEGQLTCARARLVSNDHLLGAANESGLLPYLRHRRFQPKEVFRGASVTADHVDNERLKPKTRANLVEALIGAAFVYGGELAAFRISYFLLQENRAFPLQGLRSILPKFIETQDANNDDRLESRKAAGVSCEIQSYPCVRITSCVAACWAPFQLWGCQVFGRAC